MSEELPQAITDEPLGDLGDQASRLQMAEERAAIEAALAGRVRGTDALDDRSPVVDALEGPDVQDGDAVDASDDPVYGGGTPVTDPEQARLDPETLDLDLAMTGLAEDGAAMAVDEGSSVDDSGTSFELDGDPDVLDAELVPDDESDAEDLDALVGDELDHDPDDPLDPDGYGVPPAPDGGAAAADQAELRDPVDDD